MSITIYHYTYFIKNTTNQMLYIGVRSCNGLPENDDAYMGSSKSLDEARNKTPETFTKTIIDTFPTRELANTNEQWLHEHYDVARNPLFYNQINAPMGFCVAGKHHSDKTKLKIRASGLKYYKENPGASEKTSKTRLKYFQENPDDRIAYGKRISKGTYIYKNFSSYSSRSLHKVLLQNGITGISLTTIQKYCKNLDKPFTKNAILQSSVLTIKDLGKTPKQLGFDYIPK